MDKMRPFNNKIAKINNEIKLKEFRPRVKSDWELNDYDMKKEIGQLPYGLNYNEHR